MKTSSILNISNISYLRKRKYLKINSAFGLQLGYSSPVFEVRKLTGIKSLSKWFDVRNDRSLQQISHSVIICINVESPAYFYGRKYCDWQSVVSCQDHSNFCPLSPVLSSVAPPGLRTFQSQQGNTNNRPGELCSNTKYPSQRPGLGNKYLYFNISKTAKTMLSSDIFDSFKMKRVLVVWYEVGIRRHQF